MPFKKKKLKLAASKEEWLFEHMEKIMLYVDNTVQRGMDSNKLKYFCLYDYETHKHNFFHTHVWNLQ